MTEVSHEEKLAKFWYDANPDWVDPKEKAIQETQTKVYDVTYNEINDFLNWNSKSPDEIINYYVEKLSQSKLNSDFATEFFSAGNIQKIITQVKNDTAQFEAERGGNKLPKSTKFITMKDVMQPQKPIKWIIEGIIAECSVNAFYGDPGCGKTYALFNMAVCVAEGDDWLGFKVPNAVPVLILDQESGNDRLIRRLNEVNQGRWGNDDLPINSICYPNKYFDSESDCKDVLGFIKETGAKLVIVDSYAATMSGDENAKKDAQIVITNLKKIAEKSKCAIILIHHANKAGTGERGSSAFRGGVDLLVELKKESKILNFQSKKTRDMDFINWQAEMNWNKNSNNETVFTLKEVDPFELSNRTNPESDYILQFLTNNNSSSIDDIANSTTNYTKSVLKKYLYELIEKNKVHRLNEGTHGKKAIYGLV